MVAERMRTAQSSYPFAHRATRRLCQMHVKPLQPEALEGRLVTPPARSHLHEQLEKNRVTEQRLDLRARAHADVLHHRAVLPDEDLLLRVRLDEDHRTH